jgi:predicted transcriptional regulator
VSREIVVDGGSFVSVRLDQELRDQVAAAARKDDRTLTGWIRVAIREKLERDG